VTLDVHAGDKVEKGPGAGRGLQPGTDQQARQEKSTFDSLSIEVERTGIDNRQKQLTREKDLRPGHDRPADGRARRRPQRAWIQGRRDSRDQRAARQGCAGQGRHRSRARAGRSKLQDETLAFELRTKRCRSIGRSCSSPIWNARSRCSRCARRFRGQVGQLLVQQKANVAANAALLTVVDLSALEIEAAGAGSFAHDLAIDMPAEILDGGEKYTARCRRSRRKSSRARSSRACASASTSRPACARTSA
jgi:HlyD family secretion protein